jgi:dinuclear metal center YbgI/SA1388 family protein
LPVLARISDAIAELAPWDLAESWDQVGLQIGDARKTVSKLLVSLDFNQQILEEGLKQQVDGFLVHHPLIFKPLKRLSYQNETEKLVINLLKHDFFLIAAHTNVDKAKHGLNQYLAEQLRLENIKPLEVVETYSYKVIVFGPETHLENIRDAMSRAGAGIIGDYQKCSFESPGKGTFEPSKSTHPFIGTPGIFQRVPEIRLEMIVDKNCLSRVIQAIYDNHPYEEPVFDIYSLVNSSSHGLGRIGNLKFAVTLEEFGRSVKKELSCENIQVVGELSRPIKKVALCTGSGRQLLNQAVKQQADLYLTGELNYHDFIAARENDLAVITAGHWGTEHCFVDLMADYLNRYFKSETKFEVIKGKSQAEPYLTL